MSAAIGLTGAKGREWEGPLVVECRLRSRHRLTVRYRAELPGRPLDVYVPLFMLELAHSGEAPDAICLAIDRSARSVRTIGFAGQWRPLEAEAGVAEFGFDQEKRYTHLYRLARDGQSFNLYIPKDALAGDARPSRVFLRVFIPQGNPEPMGHTATRKASGEPSREGPGLDARAQEGRVAQTARLLGEGLSPEQISKRLGLNMNSVLGYLDRAVGAGLTRRSDIYYAFPPERRSEFSQQLRRYASSRVALGDMYEDLRQLEVTLHRQARRVLIDAYGARHWWRDGVPQGVRVKCQERRELDSDEPCTAFGYTDLLDILKIIEAGWRVFKPRLPKEYGASKKALARDLRKLNALRNTVMHPVRGRTPTEQEFEFVRNLRRSFELKGVEGKGAKPVGA